MDNVVEQMLLTHHVSTGGTQDLTTPEILMNLFKERLWLSQQVLTISDYLDQLVNEGEIESAEDENGDIDVQKLIHHHQMVQMENVAAMLVIDDNDLLQEFEEQVELLQVETTSCLLQEYREYLDTLDISQAEKDTLFLTYHDEVTNVWGSL